MRKILLSLALLLAACAPVALPAPPPPTNTPLPMVAASTPTAVALAAPTASAVPPAVTPPAPATAPSATATLAPPTATADPYAELAPLTIDGLRARSFGQGSIEIVRELEHTPAFTRYLFAYSSDGLRITGMLNQPNGEGPFPPVVLNHGYYPLDAYETGNGTLRAADYLAERGFLTLAPDFRSHAASDDAPNVFRAGHVVDTLNLIPLAQRLPAARPGKVLLWGHSNGGAVAAKVLAVSDQVAAALIYAPASLNIAEDYQFRQERWARRAGQPPGRRQGVIDRLEIEFPLTPEQAPDLYSRLSPLGYARYVSARVHIIWGDQDETVPRKWPEDLYTALRDAGADATFEVYPGQPHSFDAAGNAAYLPQMAQFFSEALGPAPALKLAAAHARAPAVLAPTRAPTPIPSPTPVVVNGRVYDAYIPAAVKKSQLYQYTCEFDAAWVVAQTFGIDVSVDELIARVPHDTSVEPRYAQTRAGFVIYGGDIRAAYSGDYRRNFLARSTGAVFVPLFEELGLEARPVADRAGVEAALRRGALVWMKTTVDFKPWRPATWITPDGAKIQTVLGNDHAVVAIGFNRDVVVIRDVLGPTSSNWRRPLEYEVSWGAFMRAWGAQAFDGLAVAPPAP